MLWLAGLMGLLAAGTVGVLEMNAGSNTTESDEPEENGEATADLAETLGLAAEDHDTAASPEGDPDRPADPNPTDFVVGTEEADTLIGTGGDNAVFGEEGDDVLHGQEGADTLHGDDGNDTVYGGAGDDALFGHNDADSLHGGDGNDTLQGSAGDDVVDGDDGNDAVHGGLDNDTVSGGQGEDSLFGGWGDDLVNGVEDNPAVASVQDVDAGDYLNGGSGDDTIIAGKDDIVTLGQGADHIVMGDWIVEGSLATILDFDAADDNILLVYDDAAPEPSVTVQSNADSSGGTQVFMDGVVIANVFGQSALEPEDILVMPLSVAQSSGVAPI